MNAEARFTVVPFILAGLVGAGLVTAVGWLIVRGFRAVSASRSMRRVLLVGIPLILFAVGVSGTISLADHGAAPLATAAPFLLAVGLAVFSAVRLSPWANRGRHARQRLLFIDHPSASPGRSAGWRRRLLKVAGFGLCAVGILGLLVLGREGTPEGVRELVALIPLAIGGFILWAVYPRLKPTASQPSGAKVSVFGILFSKTGGMYFLGGLGIAIVVAVVTEKHDLAKLIGNGFIAFMVWRKWKALRGTNPTPEVGRGETSPTFLTSSPTRSRGDCPTCLSPIPADSPHGLCPRCLIRGAMPSPSSTRLRGVRPIDPPTAAEVNEFFPHLEVQELIGVGGMGAVYKARQPTLDRIVALKIVQSPRGDGDPVFAERFAREARAMAKLDHPNIVTIHESGEAGGLPFLLMEYIDGVTLREAMTNRLLTEVEALAVIPQVCDALDFAHRAGVVHRDIKPENILIDQTGRVKIADFGLAKLADPKNVTLTRTQQAMGTPHYMAPEQWEKPNEVDHRADVYALGVVLYELLTGELPLGRFALPSEKGKGDAKLDQVVIRSLAKDPAQRYQHAGDMKAALSGVQLPAYRPPAAPLRRRGFEYKSRATFLGLPLVHVVANGPKANGHHRVAKGWVAVGDVGAVGVVSVGGVYSLGVVSVGGVISVGGLLALGGAVAAGGLIAAAGALAISTISFAGGMALGKFAIGGNAVGEFTSGRDGLTPGFEDALSDFVRRLWPFS